MEYGKFKMRCRNCGGREKLNHMFARAVIDYSVLFHDTPMTKDRMHHFTGGVLNERTVRRLLNRYCDKTGRSRSTSYAAKSLDLEELLKIAVDSD